MRNFAKEIDKINKAIIPASTELEALAKTLPDSFAQTKTILYPFAHGDVAYPLHMFAQTDTLVMIDDHPFSSSYAKDLLYDCDFVAKLQEEMGTSASCGNFGPGGGYDFSGVYSLLSYRGGLQLPADVKNPSDVGLSNLVFLRLKAHFNATINHIQTPLGDDTVFDIQLIIDGKEKRIIFLRHELGTSSPAHTWLKRQNLNYGSLFMKGVPNQGNAQGDSRRREYQQIIDLVQARMNLLGSRFTIICDNCFENEIGNDEALFVSPGSIIASTQHYKFGYSFGVYEYLPSQLNPALTRPVHDIEEKTEDDIIRQPESPGTNASNFASSFLSFFFCCRTSSGDDDDFSNELYHQL